MTKVLFGILLSYLLGSIPTGFLMARLWKRIDIRTVGSGNIGATNTFRALGKIPGITVLILDVGKGVVAPFVIANLLGLTDAGSRVLLGLAVVVGHIWTVFLKFKGGKGVATSIGVLLGLSICITSVRSVALLTVASWILVFLISGYVSLASLVAALLLPIALVSTNQDVALVFLGIVFCSVIYIRHLQNIKRLFSHQEPRVQILSKRKRFP
ncbi:glycerol-3-phosphate 1-O-acyltransferase PlsY [Candidatus Omnitrophota bacterium]